MATEVSGELEIKGLKGFAMVLLAGIVVGAILEILDALLGNSLAKLETKLSQKL